MQRYFKNGLLSNVKNDIRRKTRLTSIGQGPVRAVSSSLECNFKILQVAVAESGTYRWRVDFDID